MAKRSIGKVGKTMAAVGAGIIAANILAADVSKKYDGAKASQVQSQSHSGSVSALQYDNSGNTGSASGSYRPATTEYQSNPDHSVSTGTSHGNNPIMNMGLRGMERSEAEKRLKEEKRSKARERSETGKRLKKEKRLEWAKERSRADEILKARKRSKKKKSKTIDDIASSTSKGGVLFQAAPTRNPFTDSIKEWLGVPNLDDYQPTVEAVTKYARDNTRAILTFITTMGTGTDTQKADALQPILQTYAVRNPDQFYDVLGDLRDIAAKDTSRRTLADTFQDSLAKEARKAFMAAVDGMGAADISAHPEFRGWAESYLSSDSAGLITAVDAMYTADTRDTSRRENLQGILTTAAEAGTKEADYIIAKANAFLKTDLTDIEEAAIKEAAPDGTAQPQTGPAPPPLTDEQRYIAALDSINTESKYGDRTDDLNTNLEALGDVLFAEAADKAVFATWYDDNKGDAATVAKQIAAQARGFVKADPDKRKLVDDALEEFKAYFAGASYIDRIVTDLTAGMDEDAASPTTLTDEQRYIAALDSINDGIRYGDSEDDLNTNLEALGNALFAAAAATESTAAKFADQFDTNKGDATAVARGFAAGAKALVESYPDKAALVTAALPEFEAYFAKAVGIDDIVEKLRKVGAGTRPDAGAPTFATDYTAAVNTINPFEGHDITSDADYKWIGEMVTKHLASEALDEDKEKVDARLLMADLSAFKASIVGLAENYARKNTTNLADAAKFRKSADEYFSLTDNERQVFVANEAANAIGAYANLADIVMEQAPIGNAAAADKYIAAIQTQNGLIGAAIEYLNADVSRVANLSEIAKEAADRFAPVDATDEAKKKLADTYSKQIAENLDQNAFLETLTAANKYTKDSSGLSTAVMAGLAGKSATDGVQLLRNWTENPASFNEYVLRTKNSLSSDEQAAIEEQLGDIAGAMRQEMAALPPVGAQPAAPGSKNDLNDPRYRGLITGSSTTRKTRETIQSALGADRGWFFRPTLEFGIGNSSDGIRLNLGGGVDIGENFFGTWKVLWTPSGTYEGLELKGGNGRLDMEELLGLSLFKGKDYRAGIFAGINYFNMNTAQDVSFERGDWKAGVFGTVRDGEQYFHGLAEIGSQLGGGIELPGQNRSYTDVLAFHLGLQYGNQIADGIRGNVYFDMSRDSHKQELNGIKSDTQLDLALLLGGSLDIAMGEKNITGLISPFIEFGYRHLERTYNAGMFQLNLGVETRDLIAKGMILGLNLGLNAADRNIFSDIGGGTEGTGLNVQAQLTIGYNF